MSAEELLAEINLAFDSRAFPGAEARRAGSEPDEAAPLPAAFGTLTWQQVPDEVLREEPRSLAQLSEAGFAYYLPAFMRRLVREVASSPSESEPLVGLLKLPTELGGTAVADLLRQFEAANSPATPDFADLLQGYFTQANQAIHRFIARAAHLTPAQGRAVLHFLDYTRSVADNHAAGVAIERYWFRFA